MILSQWSCITISDPKKSVLISSVQITPSLILIAFNTSSCVRINQNLFTQMPWTNYYHFHTNDYPATDTAPTRPLLPTKEVETIQLKIKFAKWFPCESFLQLVNCARDNYHQKQILEIIMMTINLNHVCGLLTENLS